MKKLIALLLCCVLLCGCTGGGLAGLMDIIPFRDMDYTRPDLEALEQTCLDACALAAQGGDVQEVLDGVWDYYDAYDSYCTNYDLAYIHYHADLSDAYWKAEHDFCAENYALVDMYLEDLYIALAQSPLRSGLEEEYFGEGFFLDYDGGSFYDEVLLDRFVREQELIAQYYALAEQCTEEEYSEAYYDALALPMAQVLADLAAVRGELARDLGFESYTDFAWEYYHYRDYTPAQGAAYLEEIRTRLVPLYENMNAMDVWTSGERPCSEREVLDYVRNAANAMGGKTAVSFAAMEAGELYDISASPNKSGMSFELFLEWYYEPYVFVSGTGTAYDCLTFAHEFGHFAMDHAADGSWAGVDVLEIFSQAMEYLSLCYSGADEDFVTMKLADSLATYVEQAAYAAFEQAMYALPPEELTAQRLLELYEQICRSYGFACSDWDPRDMITIPHLYEQPLYVISYVVSNDAAMQLYEMELQTPGAGRDCFQEHITTEESYFLAFLEEAGLQSPFGRVEQVQTLMAEHFGN